MEVLVVYGTTEGHTRKIAEFVASKIPSATVMDSADLPKTLDISSYDGFVLAGSLHQEKHQASLEAFAKENAAILNNKPTMFLSSSLSAQGDEEDRAGAWKCVEKFCEKTGFKPKVSHLVAGALLYTQYDFLKRFLMKMIVKSKGGDTDTSADYVYTDWEALEKQTHEFAASINV